MLKQSCAGNEKVNYHRPALWCKTPPKTLESNSACKSEHPTALSAVQHWENDSHKWLHNLPGQKQSYKCCVFAIHQQLCLFFTESEL